jgi:asparagine synthase (glutamine-hydrolysing)
LAKHTRIRETDLRAIFPEVPDWPAACDLFAYSESKLDVTAQWLRWNEFVGHLTMVLLKVDRASMHHSLEVRVPLLDREVIDVASRIDWHSCLDLETKAGKLPLRNSLSRHVKHQTQAKRGFEVPMKTWLKGPLKDVFQEYVLESDEIVGMPINHEPLQNMFEHHLGGQGEHTRALWTFLSLALWEQRHYRARRLGNTNRTSTLRAQPSS